MEKVSQVSPEDIGPFKTTGETPEQVAARLKRHEADSWIYSWWKGNTHSHTHESTRPDFGYAEGIYTLDEYMAYLDAVGLEFVCITEHTSKPGDPSVQDRDSQICQQLVAQAQEILALNTSRREKKEASVALSGAEVNVLFDAQGQPCLDIPDQVLSKLDFVIASRHGFTSEGKPDKILEKTPANIKSTLFMACDNPHVAMIGHPYRYTKWQEADFKKHHGDQADYEAYLQEYYGMWEEVVAKMAQTHKAFEINLNIGQDWRIVEMASKAGCDFFINFDAHDFDKEKSAADLGRPKAEAHQLKEDWAASRAQGAGEADVQIEAELADYKQHQLQRGPSAAPIFKLARAIKQLEGLGITQDRVINSSRERLLAFLTQTHNRHTENLALLVSTSS